MVAILDLKFKSRLYHYTYINYERIGPKNLRNHIIWSIIGQTIENVISNLADGSHFGFGALKKIAHIFQSGTPTKVFFKLHRCQIK